MKTYTINFRIYIHDKATTYPEVKPIDIEVKENLPANVDPQKYLRARLGEEVARAFSQVSVAIENRADDAPAEEADPLSF